MEQQELRLAEVLPLQGERNVEKNSNFIEKAVWDAYKYEWHLAPGGLFLFTNKYEGKSGAYRLQLCFLNSLLSFNYFIWNVLI